MFNTTGSPSSLGLAFAGEKTDFYPATSSWLASGLPGAKQHPEVLIGSTSQEIERPLPLSATVDIITTIKASAGPSRGAVLSEEVGSNFFAAEVRVERDSRLMLQATDQARAGQVNTGQVGPAKVGTRQLPTRQVLTGQIPSLQFAFHVCLCLTGGCFGDTISVHDIRNKKAALAALSLPGALGDSPDLQHNHGSSECKSRCATHFHRSLKRKPRLLLR